LASRFVYDLLGKLTLAGIAERHGVEVTGPVPEGYV
jgi:hypothetical protein